MADKYDLTNLSIDELPVLAGASLGAGDYIPVYDASAGKWVKVLATYFGT